MTSFPLSHNIGAIDDQVGFWVHHRAVLVVEETVSHHLLLLFYREGVHGLIRSVKSSLISVQFSLLLGLFDLLSRFLGGFITELVAGSDAGCGVDLWLGVEGDKLIVVRGRCFDVNISLSLQSHLLFLLNFLALVGLFLKFPDLSLQVLLLLTLLVFLRFLEALNFSLGDFVLGLVDLVLGVLLLGERVKLIVCHSGLESLSTSARLLWSA